MHEFKNEIARVMEPYERKLQTLNVAFATAHSHMLEREKCYTAALTTSETWQRFSRLVREHVLATNPHSRGIHCIEVDTEPSKQPYFVSADLMHIVCRGVICEPRVERRVRFSVEWRTLGALVFADELTSVIEECEFLRRID